MNKSLTNKLLVAVLMLLLTISILEASQTNLYDNYFAAYKEYQATISDGKPLAEIQNALQTFTKARIAYISSLPEASKKTAIESNSPVEIEEPSRDAQAGMQTPALQNRTAKKSISVPAEVAPILKALRSAKSAQEAKKLISQLETYIEKNADNPSVDIVEFEMAKAIDRHKLDPKKANEIFNKLAKKTDSKAGQLAKMRLKYLKAQVLKRQWEVSLNLKAKEKNEAYKKYKNTSVLAFPVKAYRLATYLAKSASFLKYQSKEADFLLWYEATCAPFSQPVDVVFDKYKASQDSRPSDENARIKLIYGNYQSWYARWRLLSEATESIQMQYFIIDDDAFGLSLLGMLQKKARDGVKVSLMVDTRGSTKLSFKVMARGYLEELAKEPNIEVKVYNPITSNLIGMFTDLRRVISSNHDKIIVVDGNYSVIGGRNIANEYLVDPIDDKLAWRDTDVVIESTEVGSQLKQAYDEEFNLLKAFEIKKSLLGLTDYRKTQLQAAYHCMNAALHLKRFTWNKGPIKVTKLIAKLNEELAQYKHMNGYTNYNIFDNGYTVPVKIVDKNSLSGPRNDITSTLVKLIDGCRKEILIQNPYIVLTPRAEAALKRASKRGVPIYVHTNSPQTSDSFPTEAMLYRDWKNILRDMPTMRIFARVNEGQLHGKNFVFDGKIGIVGTYNFDYLSEKVNSEVVAIIKSEDFSKELRDEIFFDIKKSVEYHLATATEDEFGPDDTDGKNMWLVKLISKMGFLKPLL